MTSAGPNARATRTRSYWIRAKPSAISLSATRRVASTRIRRNGWGRQGQGLRMIQRSTEETCSPSLDASRRRRPHARNEEACAARIGGGSPGTSIGVVGCVSLRLAGGVVAKWPSSSFSCKRACWCRRYCRSRQEVASEPAGRIGACAVSMGGGATASLVGGVATQWFGAVTGPSKAATLAPF